MSKLSYETVKHVAKLANLKLSKIQIIKFEKQLSNIISYVEALTEVDVKNTEETSQTTGLSMVLRDDKYLEQDCLSSDLSLDQAKNKEDDYFVVPLVLEEKTI
jgi:aspartyl-tRNA(Asn)/glutamyl-tRNA(Gln) amidotransferase subunit C